MLQCTTQAHRAIDLVVASGRLRALQSGHDGGRLTLAVHGLSANARSFDALAPEMARGRRAVVAIDLRGRGHSAITGPGTYGWTAHARDVLAVADAFRAESFDYVGHSMGAFIGMEVARLAPRRVGCLVLIDAAGRPEPEALVPIAKGLERLGSVHADADAYVAAVRGLGTVTPWHPTWEAHYRYDLVAAPSGVTPRTDRAAVMEDLAFGAAEDPRLRWAELVMPTLLVRASQPLGGGFVLTEADRDGVLRTAPRAVAVDVAANHYGVMTHADTAQSIRRFLS